MEYSYFRFKIQILISKNHIKYIKSLGIKKYRKIHSKYIAEGEKVVAELINEGNKPDVIYATAGWTDQNGGILSGIESHIVTENELKKISFLTTPNQVLGIFGTRQDSFDQVVLKTKLVISLDDIRDPGNLGTIIRTADWFGIRNIICSESCVDHYNPKVVQATMGSISRIMVFREDLAGLVGKIPHDIPIYGTLLEGENIYTTPLTDHGLIIIGNESRGISPKLLPFIRNKLNIPHFNPLSSARAESLNASIATALVCAEFRRRGMST